MRKYDLKQCALEYIDDRLADLQKYRAEQSELGNRKAAEAERAVNEALKLERRWLKLKKMAKGGQLSSLQPKKLLLDARQEMNRKRHEARDLRAEARIACDNVDRSERREKKLLGVREMADKNWMAGAKVAAKPSFPMLLKGVE